MNKKKYVIAIGIGLMFSFAACNDNNGMDNQNNAYDSTDYNTTPAQTPMDTTTVDTVGNMNDTMMNNTNPRY